MQKETLLTYLDWVFRQSDQKLRTGLFLLCLLHAYLGVLIRADDSAYLAVDQAKVQRAKEKVMPRPGRRVRSEPSRRKSSASGMIDWIKLK